MSRPVRSSFIDEEVWILVKYEMDGIISSPLKLGDVEDVDKEGKTGTEMKLGKGDKCLAIYDDGIYYKAEIIAIKEDKEVLLKEKQMLEKQMKQTSLKRKKVNNDDGKGEGKPTKAKRTNVKEVTEKQKEILAEKKKSMAAKKEAEILQHEILFKDLHVSQSPVPQTNQMPISVTPTPRNVDSWPHDVQSNQLPASSTPDRMHVNSSICLQSESNQLPASVTLTVGMLTHRFGCSLSQSASCQCDP